MLKVKVKLIENILIFFEKGIANSVVICYNLYVVIPLVTSNKISIPNTPFERFVYIHYGWGGSIWSLFFLFFDFFSTFSIYDKI